MDYKDRELFRVAEISEKLKLHKSTVTYRIKTIGIVATDNWYYDEYQIELIKDFERSPKVKYEFLESKLNTM